MSDIHPILMIHKAPWCGACRNLLEPSNFNRITSIIKKVNPSTEIKIINHENYNQTNRHDQYPPFNYIQGFPTFMITSSDNCTRKGNISKVYIFNGKHVNGQILEDKSQKLSFDAWLKKYLDPKLYKSEKITHQSLSQTSRTQQDQPVANDNVKKIVDNLMVPAGSANPPPIDKPTENKRKQRTFRLISVNYE